jgi:hypothetical protein
MVQRAPSERSKSMANEFESTSSGRKGGVTDRIKQDGKQRIETTKRSAAEQIEQVANVISRAGSELGDGQPRLANYANQAADRVNAFATRLREGSIEDLLEDTRDLARRNPGLFILGGVALGIVVSRFLKSSSSNLNSSEDWEYGTETYAGDLSAGASDYSDRATAGTNAGTGTSGVSYGTGGTGLSEQDTIDIEATRPNSPARQAQSASKTNGGLP